MRLKRNVRRRDHYFHLYDLCHKVFIWLKVILFKIVTHEKVVRIDCTSWIYNQLLQ
jgi:hypothetical protein